MGQNTKKSMGQNIGTSMGRKIKYRSKYGNKYGSEYGEHTRHDVGKSMAGDDMTTRHGSKESNESKHHFNTPMENTTREAVPL